jgi:hypothetical protein
MFVDRYYYVVCETCNETDEHCGETKKKAEERIRSLGWGTCGGKWRCPGCRKKQSA